MIFCDFEKEIDANMLNVKFLNCYYSKFCFEIMQLYDEVKNRTDCFLQQETLLVGETRQQEKPSMSISRKLFNTAKASKLLSSKQKSCLSLLSLLIPVIFLLTDFLG